MGLGTSVLLANLGSLDRTLAAARDAQAAGIGRVWLAETAGPDALVAAALIASQLDLEVGTAVVPIWTRSPAVLAMAAADVVVAGGGRRFHLGLGAGGQAIVERWHGLDFTGSVERMADTIAILRQALAGGRTGHQGVRASSSGFRLTSPPCPELVPIYVGAIGPRMVELAARAADGLILTWAPARDVTARREVLRRGGGRHRALRARSSRGPGVRQRHGRRSGTDPGRGARGAGRLRAVSAVRTVVRRARLGRRGARRSLGLRRRRPPGVGRRHQRRHARRAPRGRRRRGRAGTVSPATAMRGPTTSWSSRSRSTGAATRRPRSRRWADEPGRGLSSRRSPCSAWAAWGAAWRRGWSRPGPR